MRRLIRPALLGLLAASALVPLARADAAPRVAPGDDAVVVAVIDSGISPYHWDFLASKMPQALDRDRTNDLPLTKDPATWLKGFPKSGFASKTALKLTLDGSDENAKIATLKAKDAAQWAKVKNSSPGKINYYWFPGTKVIGGVSFGYTEKVTEAIDTTTADVPVAGYTYSPVYGTDHGQGTSSVSVGNIHGTCPECLVVHITAADTTATEQALAWAQSQPWIDVVSNSYGLQTVPTGLVRDGLYGGPVAQQKAASERGQTIVFSAGNGIENGFVVPFSTLTSSVKGPDWVVTVGAMTPGGDNESGSGKPVDLSGIGESYPSAYNGTTVTGGQKFSGTSNAAPTIAGTYARGLWLARKAMAGPSRVQAGGVISVGAATCGKARRACEIGDGRLTAVELRDRLMKGAVSTKGDIAPGGLVGVPYVVPDLHWASEGFGTYKARLKQDDELWLAEQANFTGPLLGTKAALTRPAGEAEWFVVDSWCRQHVFGSWKGGYWKTGQALPGPSADAPTRTALQVACNGLTTFPSTPRP